MCSPILQIKLPTILTIILKLNSKCFQRKFEKEGENRIGIILRVLLSKNLLLFII